jgi:hypothetical protein
LGLISTGFLLLVFLAAGCDPASNTSSTASLTSSAGGSSLALVTPTSGQVPVVNPLTGQVVFSPPGMSCAQPTDWQIQAYLLPSIQRRDKVHQVLDGYDLATYLANDPDSLVTQQADGSWLFAEHFSADDVKTICELYGVWLGANFLVPGSHTIKITDAANVVLAQGSYVVTGGTAVMATQDNGIQKGRVLFSLSVTESSVVTTCQLYHPVDQVDSKTSVFALYIYTNLHGTTPVYLAVTKNGEIYIPTSALPTNYTSNHLCLLDTTDLSQLPNWGPGLYHFVLTSDGKTISQGDLKVVAAS